MIDQELHVLLRYALDDDLNCYQIEPVTEGNSGALVARITGHTVGGRYFSIVLKSRRSKCIHNALWYSQDYGMIDREYHIYMMLQTCSIPHASVLAHSYHAPHNWSLLLDDLASNYILLPPGYEFSETEQDTIISTYAEMHSRTYHIDKEPIAEHLQVEEGQQINEVTARQMLDVFRQSVFEFSEDEFLRSVVILLRLRERWRDEPRCLVFNDFYPGNVALPKSETGYTVLFDWELAGVGLPQFDLINLGFDRERTIARYVEQIRVRGFDMNPSKFVELFSYAGLSMSFHALWLLFLKLQADPEGKLPGWMKTTAESLMGGRLIADALLAEG